MKRIAIVLAIIHLIALFALVAVPRVFEPSKLFALVQVFAGYAWLSTLVLVPVLVLVHCEKIRGDVIRFDGFSRMMCVMILASALTECVSWLLLMWGQW